MPDWEVFKRKHVPYRASSMTIAKTGLFLINRAAWDLIYNARTVDLLFDPEQRVIGLRPSEATSAYRISGRGARVTLSGSAFLRYYEIAWRSMRFPAFLHDDVLCINVSEPGLEIASNAAR